MPPATTRYFDWNEPLLPAVTAALLDLAEGEPPALDHVLVVVPTRQSRRRLLESLAARAAKAGGGLLPPRVLTPESLLAPAPGEAPVAEPESVLAAWTAVLGATDWSRYPAVFPAEPPSGTGWRLGTARRLADLRTELGEEGLDIAGAAARAAEASLETARWRQLASLEEALVRRLESAGLRDPLRARRERAGDYEAPAGIERIVLAATPDPQALALRALENAARTVPVEVWTCGPADGAELFDAWGRPEEAAWAERALAFEAWGCRFETFADPEGCAARTARLMSGREPESAALGVCDSELGPAVAEALENSDIPCFDPSGEALDRSGPGRLAELLCRFAGRPDTTAVRSLLQHPDMIAWLGAPGADRLLARLDRIFERHLCADLASLRRFAGRDTDLAAALERLDEAGSVIRAAPTFARGLVTVLETIYADRDIPAERGDGLPWREQADALRGLLERSAAAAEAFSGNGAEFEREAFRRGLRAAKVYPDRPREAHDLLGWLELLWNDAPHLVLAGPNEGAVPESVVGDAFLPEGMREQLGLRTNARRFARDAYLLEASCRRRAGDAGRIDVLLPQSAADGTPLKPSRLFFPGPPGSLLPRARTLLTPAPRRSRPAGLVQPWTCEPPAGLPLPETLSVSSLALYLRCPFRFFLSRILDMRPVDVRTRELGPAAFGTLFHDTVAKLKGLTVDASLKPDALFDKLRRIARETLVADYGDRPSFALRLQETALLARLGAFARRQCEDAETGGPFTIEETEKDFSVEIGGVPVRGRIDRIDRYGDSRLELVDYKTADSPVTPAKAHLAAVARKAPPAHLPEEAFFEDEGKTWRWTDLQLPLYVLAARESDRPLPRVAYFNLGKTAEKSGLARWDDFSETQLESARTCAEALVRQIRDGVFWPPNPDAAARYDEFAPLFPEGIEKSVRGDAFARYNFAEAPAGDPKQ